MGCVCAFWGVMCLNSRHKAYPRVVNIKFDFCELLGVHEHTIATHACVVFTSTPAYKAFYKETILSDEIMHFARSRHHLSVQCSKNTRNWVNNDRKAIEIGSCRVSCSCGWWSRKLKSRGCVAWNRRIFGIRKRTIDKHLSIPCRLSWVLGAWDLGC